MQKMSMDSASAFLAAADQEVAKSSAFSRKMATRSPVESLVTGQTFDLYVVGQDATKSSGTQALFGEVLTDESVVQALSGGHPLYA